MEQLIYIVPLFFLTALIYSSVGFGGGSTYLALLVLFNVNYILIPQIALICNIIVVLGGLYHHLQSGNFHFKRALPFVILSIPMAYLGGRIMVSESLFFWLLGFALMVAGVRLFFVHKNHLPSIHYLPSTIHYPLFIGALLGFLSGLTGLGGGIFLAPILYLIRWGNARQIAALCSFFILVNSLAGLWGQVTKNGFTDDFVSILPLMIAVFLGGQLGSRLSVGRLSLTTLQKTTAVLILIVAGRIFGKLIFA